MKLYWNIYLQKDERRDSMLIRLSSADKDALPLIRFAIQVASPWNKPALDTYYTLKSQGYVTRQINKYKQQQQF